MKMMREDREFRDHATPEQIEQKRIYASYMLNKSEEKRLRDIEKHVGKGWAQQPETRGPNDHI